MKTNSAWRTLRRAAFAALIPAAVAAQQPDTVFRVVDTRSPVIAGFASYLFPGLGSLYAGSGKHALVHSSVAVASYVALVWAIESTHCTETKCDDAAQATVGLTSLGAFLVNSVWSIVSAVQDANAYNAAQRGRLSARPYVAPTRVTLDTPRSSATVIRLGVSIH